MYRKISLLFIGIFVFLCLSACSAGISIDDGKKYTEDFWAALNEENYEAAADLMHPISGAAAGDIEAFARDLENEFGFNFGTDTVSVTGYTGFNSLFYTSDVDGAMLTLSFEINIGGRVLSGSSDIVSNDNGFGISAINIERGNLSYIA